MFGLVCRTKVSFAAGGEKFSVSGRAVISPGFTAVMPWLAVADESLPTFSVGETISLSEVELYQVHNQHFTQSNFLKIAHCKLVVGAPVCNLTVHFAGTDGCTRLPHREWAYHSYGETRHWYWCINPSTHQQHMWTQLCTGHLPFLHLKNPCDEADWLPSWRL